MLLVCFFLSSSSSFSLYAACERRDLRKPTKQRKMNLCTFILRQYKKYKVYEKINRQTYEESTNYNTFR